MRSAKYVAIAYSHITDMPRYTGCCVCVCVWLQIRKDYYDENIKAGPQSRILEGVTWDEAQKIRVSCQCLSLTVCLTEMINGIFVKCN